MRDVAATRLQSRETHFGPVGLMETLPEAARSELESLMHVSSYPPNVIVFSEEEPATCLYLVLEPTTSSMPWSELKRKL